MTILNEKIVQLESGINKIWHKTDANRWIWLIFAGICLNLLYQLCLSPVFYRDSTVYYQMAQSFALGDWPNAFALHLPILFPTLAGVLVCCGIPSMPAMLLVSGLSYAATVFPLFHVLKRFFTDKQAVIGVLLFALNYDIASSCCAPLLDSGRLFFMISACALLFSDDDFSWKRLGLFGLCCGALSLVRGEGVILAGMMLAAHFIYLRCNYHKSIAQCFLRMLISAGVMSLICLPRLWQFYCETGVPALEIRQVNAFSQAWGHFFPEYSFTVSRYAFAGGNDMNISSGGFFNNMRFYKNFIDGFFLLYIPLTILGCIAVIRDAKWNFKHTLLLALFGAYNLFHFIIQASAGRYFIINCFFALPLTTYGVIKLTQFLCQHPVVWRRLAVLATAVIAGILIYKSFSFADLRHKKEFRKYANVLHQKFPEQVNLLVVGADRGSGYYLNANVCLYQDYPYGLESRIPLQSVLIHGIDSGEMSYKHTKEMRSPVFFDAILVSNSSRKHLESNLPHIFSEKNILCSGRKYTLYSNPSNNQ